MTRIHGAAGRLGVDPGLVTGRPFRAPHHTASLAGLLGASRQSVNEALSELRDAGAVETGYRVITLADRDALAAAAGR